MMRTCWMYRWRRPISAVILGFFGTATVASAQNIPDLPGAPAAPPPPPAAARNPTAANAAAGAAAAPASSGLSSIIPASATARAAQSLNFRDAPVDMVLEYVADLLGRTLIKNPGVTGQVTLKSNGKLTVEESLQAIEATLAMANITMVPMGEKFLKVVQTAEARTHAMPISVNLPGAAFLDDDKLVSQVVQLKYVEIAEVSPVLESLKRSYGKIQPLERTNSLLITDTQGNLKRMLEILEYLDQPAEAQVETRVYELRYAEAGAIAGRINELIADSQGKEDKPRVEQSAPAANTPPSPPGVIRAPRATSSTAPGATGGSALEQAERGIIRGKVKIIADERTNIIFVISRPENFAFFDKIVAVLDRPVEAEIGVRVVPLEYAKAEDLSTILNEFIGAASAEKKSTGTAAAGDKAATPGDTSRSTELRDFLRSQAQARLEQAQTQQQQQQADGKGTIGRLSSSTKILADKRTNSLLLMGRKSDLDALELVLDSLDVMLAQVLIEAAILEVNLGDQVDTGFDWLQRSVVAYNEQKSGPNGGVSVRTPVFSFGGGSVNESGAFRGGDQVTRSNTGQSAGGLSYYATLNDLNVDAILRLAGSSSDAKVISTPVVLTTDNTEAKIVAAEQRPVVTSTSLQTTGQQTQNFEYRTIGINIAVTPRINPSGFVMMEIEQSADDVLGETTINNTTVPIISKREMSAQIGVQSRQTVVLGGLVRTDNSKSRSKVPWLGDIPLFGMFFRSDSKKRNRTELMVLLTPYVLKSPQEALDETRRLYTNSRNSDSGGHRGWSDSPLFRQKPEDLLRLEKERLKQGQDEGHARMKKQTLLDTFTSGSAKAEPAAHSRTLEDIPVEAGKPAPEVIPPVAPVAPAPIVPAAPKPAVDPSEPPSSAADAPDAPVPVR